MHNSYDYRVMGYLYRLSKVPINSYLTTASSRVFEVIRG